MRGDVLQFVDPNILLYAYDKTAGERHARARQLVGELGRSQKGVLSTQVLQEFYVNATRKIAAPLVPALAIERLKAFSRWRIHVPGPADVVAAAELSSAGRISYWDAAIVQSAQSLGCEILWSEDLSDGQQFGPTTIRNPFH